MSNRWHMNRKGFVNFWLYDEETFHFAEMIFPALPPHTGSIFIQRRGSTRLIGDF